MIVNRKLSAKFIFIARPLTISSGDCLVCHSTPAAAPKSLVDTYGPDGGFGWQLNEIIAAQIIYVPAAEVFNTALRSFLLILTIFIVIFGAIILTINFLLRQFVIEPVGILGDLATKLSADQIDASDIESKPLIKITTRADELGSLAQVFQQTAQEVFSRTQRLRQQVSQLRIEIDEIKQKQQVSEIVETDFFKDLQDKAREIRQQHQEKKRRPDDGE